MQGAKDWTSEVCNELVVLEGFSGHQELQGLASALSFALTLFFCGGSETIVPSSKLIPIGFPPSPPSLGKRSEAVLGAPMSSSPSQDVF